MEAIETFEVGNLTVQIHQDQDPESPREWDNLGTMVCWHRRYNLGDVQRTDDPDQFFLELAEEHRAGLEDYLGNKLWTKIVKTDFTVDQAKYDAEKKAYYAEAREIVWRIIDKNYVLLPLGLIDHSGISMYVGSGAHSCDPGGWDSGQVGWIYMSREKIFENWPSRSKTKRLTKALRKEAEEVLRGEVTAYDEYLTGQVYGFVIEDNEGNHVDSCWGFYGLDYCKQEAKQAAEGAIEHEAEEVAKIDRMMAL